MREGFSELDLDVNIRPCPKKGERFRPELVPRGGQEQVPLLLVRLEREGRGMEGDEERDRGRRREGWRETRRGMERREMGTSRSKNDD